MFSKEKQRTDLGQRMMLLRPPHSISSAFIELVLNSPHVTRIADESILGGCAPHINVGEIKAFAIPLPPLAEQAGIVARVEALMVTCSALEAEIAYTRTHAAQLLQAVLKEAFANATS
jgi:type I restriction enzyme S subunit